MNLKNQIFFALFLILANNCFAQDDKPKTKSVDINSVFKPALISNAKINFIASRPKEDTSKPALTYNVPNANLNFAYQPGSLKPIALQIDSISHFENKHFIKVGFGSLKSPLLHAGFSIGDGLNSGANLIAKYNASQGSLPYQKYNTTQARINAFYKLANNNELSGSIGMRQDKTFKYGYRPDTLMIPSDSLKQNFQTYNAGLTFRNIHTTSLGINYAPSLNFAVFSDNRNNTESNSTFLLPIEKRIGERFAAGVAVQIDFTNLNRKNKSRINNNAWQLEPSITFSSQKIELHAGIRPSWNNAEFKMFPNITLSIGAADKRFNFIAGWTGYIRPTTYQNLAQQNSWLQVPDSLHNSLVTERFAGFKGSLDNHFNYNIKAAYKNIKNQPLFINYPTTNHGDGKSFAIDYEADMNAVSILAELGYNVGEKFSLITNLQITDYTALSKHAKAWGLIPIEWNTSLRLQLLKDLWIKGDLFAWSDVPYLGKDGLAYKTKGTMDLNAGIEFKIVKNLSAWAQFNNIMNKQYMRWNQYPVYGFNLLGGIIYNFGK